MPTSDSAGISDEGAIAAALGANWKEAIRINTLILKSNSESIEALSRLAFAYLKAGQFASAKRFYQKVLDLDPYNQIAEKNLRKLTALKRKDLSRDSGAAVSPLMFLEDPGKTKIAECINLAPTQVLSTLSSGTEVFLKARNHCVEIRDAGNTYIAALPDDLSFKLIKLLSAGNRYQAFIKGVEKKSLKVFLREITRGKRFAHQPSFIANTSYVPFSRSESAVTDHPDVTPTGEGEEGEQNEGETPAPSE